MMKRYIKRAFEVTFQQVMETTLWATAAGVKACFSLMYR